VPEKSEVYLRNFYGLMPHRYFESGNLKIFMAAKPRAKVVTQQIAISEPDEDLLKKSLQGRELSPGLTTFLENLIRTKKWAREITLPSSHDDLAVALVSTSTLKEGGLEILSELHVFFAGDIIIEEWQVVGEREQISALPKEIFSSISIHKVIVDGDKVIVELQVPMSEGTKAILKTFDFAIDGPRSRSVLHPLFEVDNSV